MSSRLLGLAAAVLVALSVMAPTASATPATPSTTKAPGDFVALSDVDPTILQEIRPERLIY